MKTVNDVGTAESIVRLRKYYVYESRTDLTQVSGVTHHPRSDKTVLLWPGAAVDRIVLGGR